MRVRSLAAALLMIFGSAGYAAIRESTAPDALYAQPTVAPFYGGAPVGLLDPPGDATKVGASGPVHEARCAAGYHVMGQCLEPVAPESGAGVPAPQMDILWAGLVRETPREIELGMDLARVEAERAPQPDDPPSVEQYAVCWRPSSGLPDRCAVLEREPGTKLRPDQARFEIRSDDCNEWGLCAWTVPARVEAGEPGRIVWVVPKHLATHDGAPASMAETWAVTTWTPAARAAPLWHVHATLQSPAESMHVHAAAAPRVVDLLEPQRTDIRFQPAPPQGGARPGGPLLAGTPDPSVAAHLDLLGFDLAPHGTDLLAVFTLRALPGGPPAGVEYRVAIGLERVVWEIGLRGGAGAAAYAGRCVLNPCAGGFVAEVAHEVRPGSPARVVVRVPFELLAVPPGGAATTLVWAETVQLDASLGPVGAHDLEFSARSERRIDGLMGGVPYAVVPPH